MRRTDDGVVTDGRSWTASNGWRGEAHGLYARNSLRRADGERLRQIRTELDRCWNLLRQRLALPDDGRDRDEAPVPAETVESYEG